jgi:hypothetical protein
MDFIAQYWEKCYILWVHTGEWAHSPLIVTPITVRNSTETTSYIFKLPSVLEHLKKLIQYTSYYTQFSL